MVFLRQKCTGAVVSQTVCAILTAASLVGCVSTKPDREPERVVLFVEEGDARLPDLRTAAYSAAAGDLDGDGDGDTDIVVVGRQTARILVNDSEGRFSERSLFSEGTPPYFNAKHVLCEDLDGDGDLDVYVAGLPDFTFLNDGSGRMNDVSEEHLPERLAWGLSDQVACGDVDGDGDPDLVRVSRLTPDSDGMTRLLLNDGAGRFADMTTEHLPRTPTGSNACAWADLDGDGDFDLLLAGLGEHLWLNDGAGQFSDGSDRLPSDSLETRDVVIADFDGDGDDDLFLGNVGPNALWLNDGAGHFSDASHALPQSPDRYERTLGVVMGDFDGDGDPDLGLANYLGPDRMLFNVGLRIADCGMEDPKPETRNPKPETRLFRDATWSEAPWASTDLLAGDFDGDGLTDLYLATSRSPKGERDRLWMGRWGQEEERSMGGRSSERSGIRDEGAEAGISPWPRMPARSTAIAMTPDGAEVWVVDPDHNAVTVIDASADTVVTYLPTDWRPRTIAMTPDGRFAYVANLEADNVTVLRVRDHSVEATVQVGVRPFGVVADPEGRYVYVSNSNSDDISVLRVEDHQVVDRIPVGDKPRGLALTRDGGMLYVGHFLTAGDTGYVSAVDVAARRVAARIPIRKDPDPLSGGYPNLLEGVVLTPSEDEVWLLAIHSNSDNRQRTAETTVQPIACVLDPGTNRERFEERLLLNSLTDRPTCGPTDVAFSPKGAYAYVVHQYSNSLSIVRTADRREVRQLYVGGCPQGIALTPDGRTAYVMNYTSRTVSVLDMSDPLYARVLRTIRAVDDVPAGLSEEIIRGLRLWMTAGGFLSNDSWISCNICHGDGTIDGRTWFFPSRGPRQTPNLHGVRSTFPVFSGDRNEIQDIDPGIPKILFGMGLAADPDHPPLGPPNAGRSRDLDALAAFVRSLNPYSHRNPYRHPDGSLTEAARRGETLFLFVGCAECHRGIELTDNLCHDVGTMGPEDVAGEEGFNTPSLRGAFDTAPYLHDGSARTLMDVLTARNPEGEHGNVSGLSEGDLRDLVEYLKSL